MARVVVVGAEHSGDRIERLEIRLEGLSRRIIDRDTALAWLADGHSFLPEIQGRPGRALQRVEVEGEVFIRDDHEAEAADALPADLPALTA